MNVLTEKLLADARRASEEFRRVMERLEQQQQKLIEQSLGNREESDL